MGEVKIIDVNVGIFDHNDQVANEIRAKNKERGLFMVNLMASPGAGKTSTILKTVEMLGDEYKTGVMEADIEATVDAEIMAEHGIRTIQVHTGGECAMDASMTGQALDNFDTTDLDLVFLENVGNLVCTAEQDTGATVNVEILSVPEGDDKPLKYPLMFSVCHAVIINKTDTTGFFPFDKDALIKRVHALNPDAEIFFVSAKTGEGMREWVDWLRENIRSSSSR